MIVFTAIALHIAFIVAVEADYSWMAEVQPPPPPPTIAATQTKQIKEPHETVD